MSNNEKAIIIDELWLIYFNDTLREQGLISEREWIQMKSKIYENTAHKRKRAKLEEKQ